MPAIVAEYIDRLVTVEMRMKGLPRHTTLPLYEASRAAQGVPLTYRAAAALLERVAPGRAVLLVTGAGMPPSLPFGETDGPLGAASLARALVRGLGARPVFVVQPNHTAPVAAAAKAAGIPIVDETAASPQAPVGLLATVPPGIQEGTERARDLFSRFAPVAVVFIEKVGPNRMGYYHGVLGYGRAPGEVANVVPLIDLARQSGAVTIGIGDGGNEIGFGLIYETVRRIQTYGSRCRCPCGEGIATVVATDILVAAAISNWGAYGVAANLAFHLHAPSLLQTPEEEHAMLAACVAAGAADGATGKRMLAVDGTPADASVAVVTLLHDLIATAQRLSERTF